MQVVDGLDAQDSVHIGVADRGPGYPAELADSQVDRFIGAEGPRRAGRGGLGIGLALARELSECMVVASARPRRPNWPFRRCSAVTCACWSATSSYRVWMAWSGVGPCWRCRYRGGRGHLDHETIRAFSADRQNSTPLAAEVRFGDGAAAYALDRHRQSRRLDLADRAPADGRSCLRGRRMVRCCALVESATAAKTD